EWVTFGSPRLHQVAKHLKGQSQYTRLFQVMHTHEQTMLHPWLVLNYCVRYEGKQIKEKLFSIGLHLIKGTIVHDMMENLQQIDCTKLSVIIVTPFHRLLSQAAESTESRNI